MVLSAAFSLKSVITRVDKEVALQPQWSSLLIGTYYFRSIAFLSWAVVAN